MEVDRNKSQIQWGLHVFLRFSTVLLTAELFAASHWPSDICTFFLWHCNLFFYFLLHIKKLSFMQFCTFDDDMRPQAFLTDVSKFDCSWCGEQKKGTNQAAWNGHTMVACRVVCALNTWTFSWLITFLIWPKFFFEILTNVKWQTSRRILWNFLFFIPREIYKLQKIYFRISYLSFLKIVVFVWIRIHSLTS